MSVEEEIRRITKLKTDTLSKIIQGNNQSDEIDYKIRRLENAYNRIHVAKRNFESLKNDCKKTVNDKYEWKGTNYNQVQQYGNSLLDYYKDYIKYLDRVQDAINNEKLKLKNSQCDIFSAIGTYRRTINWCETKLRNLMN